MQWSLYTTVCYNLSLFPNAPAIMRKFNHPHIIRLFGVVSHEQATYIIMELAPMGQVGGARQSCCREMSLVLSALQLRRYLLTEGSLIGRLCLLQYLRQLASAMVHLESKNYVHRSA